MRILNRLYNRIRLKKRFKGDESRNVVDGMAKARRLYKELALKAHPDRNPHQRELAEELTARLANNKFNYIGLLELKKEIEKKL